MWDDICNDSRIRVRSEFFGIRTIAIYVPPQSVVDAETIEYTQKDGDRLLRILTAPREELIKTIGDFRPEPTQNGNYLLEIARSRNSQFAALLLMQYKQLRYEAVTPTLVFEGEEAQVVCQMFQ